MSCYVLTIPDGDLYACSDRCASDVFRMLATLDAGVVAMHWSAADNRDVFCSGCCTPLGWRRRSALVFHREMTPTARRLYVRIQKRWWRDVAAR